MTIDYTLTLDNGEAVNLEPLPPGENNNRLARHLIHTAVYDLAQQHEADRRCAEHRGLSIRRVNIYGSMILNYRVRFVCYHPDGSTTAQAGTARPVNRDQADIDLERETTRLAEAYAEIIHQAEGTAARRSA